MDELLMNDNVNILSYSLLGSFISYGKVSLSYKNGWYRIIPSTVIDPSTTALNSKLLAAPRTKRVCKSSSISRRSQILG